MIYFLTIAIENDIRIMDIYQCKKAKKYNDRYLLSLLIVGFEARNYMPPGMRVKSIYVFKLQNSLKTNVRQNEY